MQLVKQQLSGDISSRYLFRLRFAATPNTPLTPRASSQRHSCLQLRCAVVVTAFCLELKAWALKNELRQ